MKAHNIKQDVYALRVHIEDTDCTGIVYHPNYLKFIERARSEWLIKLGLDVQWQLDQGIYFVVHSVNMRFIKPVRVHEQVEVVTRCTKMGHASLELEQYLRAPHDDSKIIFSAKIKVACVNQDFRPTSLPESQRLRSLLT